MVFPNIEARNAKVQFIVRKFSDLLDRFVDYYRDKYQNMDLTQIIAVR